MATKSQKLQSFSQDNDKILMRIKELEAKFKQFDQQSVLPVLKKTLADHESSYQDINLLRNNKHLCPEEIQLKMQNKLAILINENKKIDKQLQINQTELRRNREKIERDKRALDDVRNQNEHMRKNLEQERDSNQRYQQEIDKLEQSINEKKQGSYMMFKKTLETLYNRSKEYEVKIQINIFRLNAKRREAQQEESKILVIQEEIDSQHQIYKEVHQKYKEQIGLHQDNLTDQKNYNKRKFEDMRQKARELSEHEEDFKRRFVSQSRQNQKNKQRSEQIEKEIMRTMEKKNYLEKEIQEVNKQKENQKLIKDNLHEEVTQFRKETNDMDDRRKNLCLNFQDPTFTIIKK
ncbi:UNKNOWN [Stylonychia lemnae]|uniref:Uncharacterized protein n=1 Tax=Stylonychia lemnae TaxID=5949 RepID=A0A078AFC0_STYLE|nr:UNKNOWN [Stylonychia lemnae]|eukprot:CDW79618.1 UNKNOWN [Stylonychia lemnae]